MIVILNVVIFALSARVNNFQDYFCQVFIFGCPSTSLNSGFTDVADILPLALSVATSGIAVLACVPRFSTIVVRVNLIVLVRFLLDVGLHNSPTARPSVDIAVLLVLSIFWLGQLFS